MQQPGHEPAPMQNARTAGGRLPYHCASPFLNVLNLPKYVGLSLNIIILYLMEIILIQQYASYECILKVCVTNTFGSYSKIKGKSLKF